MIKPTRLFDILPYAATTYPEQKIALAGKQNGETAFDSSQWRKYSIQEYIETTDNLSFGFIKLGIQKEDKVAIISSNRPEWNMLDMAIMQIGAIPVPIYPTITEEEYRYILNHAEVTCLFVEESLLRKVVNILPEIVSLKNVFTFGKKDEYKSFADLVDLGKSNPDEAELDKRRTAVKNSDTACIIYTSGTTANPKGVMLSHNNVLQQLYNLEIIPSKWSKIAFSFLPLCHTYEKMLVYLYQYLGMSVYYAESLATLSDNIKEVNPTMMSCVPRVLEKIYDKLYVSGKKLPFIQRVIYYWAFRLATKYKIDGLSWWYKLKHKIADKLIYSKWRNAIGGNFDIVVSGSAAIQPHIAAFFSAIGMPVFEGYGLTESSPVIAVSCREKNGRCFGTVGFPLPGVEVKIGDRDEIICRGHNVMQGYYKEPALTAEVIDKDGWLHTGDTGRFTNEGQLVITGRLKSIFKTSFGKYVNPQLIEEKLTQSPFIENMMVVGENQKFAAALIVPDFVYLKQWAKDNKIDYSSNEEAVKIPAIKKQFESVVKEYNAFFGDTEKIKKFELIADEWSQDTGILTPTLKVKRRVIQEKYKREIEKLFE
ncbi:MAG: long-chain fatty acid--CoA ligase [Dysgonamonadaceae bacterium]|jgi:long-chain acyl-CoA synthetase|nr:long-chain fatty acid--CoA ligase [Dysgonamonadaceae bacterium]